MRRSLIPLIMLLPAGYAQAQTAVVPLPPKPAPTATANPGLPAPAPAPVPDGPVSVPLPTPGPAPATSSPNTAPPPRPGKFQLPTAPPLNPYGRAIDLTVNVQYFQRDLGEVAAHMAIDGSVEVDAANLIDALKPLLNETGLAKLTAAVGGRTMLALEELKASGIDAQFDRENVSVNILTIDSAMRRLMPLYRTSNDAAERHIDAVPEAFSFFLDVTVAESRVWNGPNQGWRDPAVFLNGATRVGPVVLEAQGQFADRQPGTLDPQYHFDRSFVRLVYDIPEKYLRLYAGDLSPEVRFQQNYVPMGGVGLSRQKRRFDSYRAAILQGNRQLILQNESTVDVYRNGVLFQQILLAPGAYDLGNLPLLSGSNDIQINVRDGSGVSQRINYQTYLDPIDLDPGDFEMGAFAGKTSTRFGLSPTYDGDWAFTGFYRKAFIGHPAVGVGVQASRQVQQFSAQTQFLIGRGARIDVTGGVSNSKLGTGYLLGISYDLALDQGSRATTVNLQGVFQSRLFTGLGAPFQINQTAFSGNVLLTHTFSPRTTGQVGATYVLNRRPAGDDYRLYVEGYHRLSSTWSVRAGIDYQHLGFANVVKRRNGFGFNVGLVYQPDYRNRAEARYDYHLDTAQVSYEHSPDGYVGSVGYGGVATRSSDQTSFQGYANYSANRFDAAVSHSLIGNSLGNVTNRQISTVRVSTAIVYAGGGLAITRRIGDSFAILEPHPSLRGHDIIIGQLLTESGYRSKSGALGGAVRNGLGSYVTQSIEYDVVDPPAGYDIGTGVVRVRPPYHSGYHIVVGTDAFVTSVGTAIDGYGKPVSLTSGQVSNLTRPEEAKMDFFTNSVGRFAMSTLRPNDRYRVQLSSGQFFEFTVPGDNEGLFDMHSVTVSAPTPNSK